jgi:hypothetical protein
LGLDRLMPSAAALALVVAGCGGADGGRPSRLLDGRTAAQFEPVGGSVIASGRVLDLDGRADGCLAAPDRANVASDAQMVERIGVDGESLTFASRDGSVVYACDGGVDPAGERNLPWCHAVVGELDAEHVLDPRLDVICRDRRRRPLAYAFVDPVPGARWIGVRQDGYVEIYEVLAALPVRVATIRGVDVENDTAAFAVTQYDAEGRKLVEGELEAAVAG